jgi:hypothetical protein
MPKVVVYVNDNNTVVDMVPQIDGADIEQRDGLTAYPDAMDYGVAIGWIRNQQGGYEPSPVPPVPAHVTPRQMRKALRIIGVRSVVDAYVATLTEEQQEDWEYATTIDRNNELIAMAGAGLGMTEDQVNDLFRLAATL